MRHSGLVPYLFIGLIFSVCSSVIGWTTPQPILRTSQDSLDPRVTIDSEGYAHVVWRERVGGSTFQIWYTHDTSGTFASPVEISQGDSVHCYQVDLDADGTDIHTVWMREDDGMGDPLNFEVWYRKKDSSTGWGPIYNASNTPHHDYEGKSLQPAVAARYGTNPLVTWQENIWGYDNYDIYLSEWTGSGFSQPPMNLSDTAGGDLYGSVTPNMTVAPNGDVTVAWVDRISGTYHVNTRRMVNGSWQPRQEITSVRTGPTRPGIAAGPNNTVWVCYFEEYSEADWYVRVQHFDGSSWSDAVRLPVGLDHPNRTKIAVDGNGYAHVICDAITDAQNNREIFHSTNMTGSWSNWENISQTNATDSLYGEIFADDNRVFVVWEETQTESGGEGTFNTWYTFLPVSTGPPDPVASFTATGQNQQAELTWTNPSSPNFNGTMIRVKTTGYPTGPEDGTLVVDKTNYPGSEDSHIHTGLQNGQTYYYAAFAHDFTPIYAAGVTGSAVPHPPGDFNADNDVDMEDFAAFQLCLTGSFNPQEDPACVEALMDTDDDVDQDDVSLFKGCLSGANVVADPGCASQ